MNLEEEKKVEINSEKDSTSNVELNDSTTLSDPTKINNEIDKDDTSKKADTNSSTTQQSKKNTNSKPNSSRGPRGSKRKSEYDEQIVDVARVTNVVKGGRRFSFSVLVVIGNRNGNIGYGHGKANEVPNAIKKAIKNAQSNLISVPIVDKRTIPHISDAKYLSSKVLLKPAPKGKGIIASGTVRSVVELAGYKDIYTKSLGSRTKTNTVKATLEALKKMRTIEEIANLRDKTKSEILG